MPLPYPHLKRVDWLLKCQSKQHQMRLLYYDYMLSYIYIYHLKHKVISVCIYLFIDLFIRLHEIVPSPRVNPGSSCSDSQHFCAETRAHYDLLSTRLVTKSLYRFEMIGTNSRMRDDMLRLGNRWQVIPRVVCDNQKGFTPAL